MKYSLALAAVLMTGCTYGPPEDHVTVQNVSLKPDATILAVIVKYERYQEATGLAAFPDGGVLPLPSCHARELHTMNSPAGHAMNASM